MTTKTKILSNYLECSMEDADKLIEDGDYLVLTDLESDELYDEYINNYITDCILPEIPEQFHCYFDEDKFKRDIMLEGNRGSMLAAYDGEENEVKVGSEWYYIYRQN